MRASSCAWVIPNSSLPPSAVKLCAGIGMSYLSVLTVIFVASTLATVPTAPPLASSTTMPGLAAAAPWAMASCGADECESALRRSLK